ncbi:mlo-like protein 14 [Phtheirospermum japonicum]|uniref:MLO-like protein n=1 Tax=Phtheirospermum japonicum TaxID=374723 RepID=A0A830CHU1_9LAMI|nr:mlo-like protein 14 [Phtheirospermum japonicum]
MLEENKELRSLGLTPTWSVASVLTVFIFVSLLLERSIHRLGNWLKKTNRKPLQAAVEKMKEELMLLGFISLLLTATSSIISNICIPSKFYGSVFTPCTDSEVHESLEKNSSNERKLFIIDPHSYRRMLTAVPRAEIYLWSFFSNCSIIHSWRVWEDEAQMIRHNSLHEITKALTLQRQSSFVRVHASNPKDRSRLLVWVVGLVSSDNLGVQLSVSITLLSDKASLLAPLWGFVVAFMLFNVKGSNLYFWIALIPVALVLFVGTKLQHVIATLALESLGISGGHKFKLRDELFTGQFLCSYSTLPLYALVTQMGSNYKAALIPQRIRETIHGWKKAARRRRRLGGFADDATVTDTSTVISLEEYDSDQLPDTPRFTNASAEIELQTHNIFMNDNDHSVRVANENSSRVGTPLLQHSASISSPVSLRILPEVAQRSSSMPR